MSIKSDSFGRVILTDEDAKKFRNQAAHGRPKATAVESVQRGVKLARTFESTGKVFLETKVPA